MRADWKSLQLSRGAEEGFELELKHPVTGAPTGWKWRLRGADSATLARLQLEQRRRRLAEFAKTGMDRVDPAVFDDETLETLIAATISWDGADDGPGVPFECTPSNVRQACAERWIREQVSAAIASRANFLPRSATGS